MRNQRGVTVVALVITVIVLLLLATATISMVIGDTGVLTNSKKAKEDSRRQSARDIIELALSSIRTNLYAKEAEQNKEIEKTNVDTEFLKNELSKQMPGYMISNVKTGYTDMENEEKEDGYTIEFKDEQYTYTAGINSELTISMFSENEE